MNFNLLLALIFLSACQLEVPAKVKHEGEIVTKNVIEIQITVPDSLLTAFTQTCETKCESDKQCVDDCMAEQQVTYTNQILALITQFQQIATPITTATF